MSVDLSPSPAAVAPAAGKRLLHLDNVSRHFGTLKAVHEVTFNMAAGELRAVIGPNGAG
jgi:ABC-type branched-subunit amino acid transport system ATPase component